MTAASMSCRAVTGPSGSSSARSCSRTPRRRCPVTVADTRTATATLASRLALSPLEDTLTGEYDKPGPSRHSPTAAT
jgi:hypothetical protein